jgi:hypothetical protein
MLSGGLPRLAGRKVGEDPDREEADEKAAMSLATIELRNALCRCPGSIATVWLSREAPVKEGPLPNSLA